MEMHHHMTVESASGGQQYYHMEFDSIPIVLSCAISFLGSYAAIVTFEQYRLCKYLQHSPKLFRTHVELLIIAILLGGVAIWAMHFVGMSSCVLKYPASVFGGNADTASDVTSPIYYRIDLTIASLIAVVVLCYAGIN
jgi:NO-binding membrane sensor protein with MHYT domain